MSALPAAPLLSFHQVNIIFYKNKESQPFFQPKKWIEEVEKTEEKTHDRILSCRCVILFETILRNILSIHQVSKFSICLVDNENKSIGTNHL